jgi:hypothetical protein
VLQKLGNLYGSLLLACRVCDKNFMIIGCGIFELSIILQKCMKESKKRKCVTLLKLEKKVHRGIKL